MPVYLHCPHCEHPRVVPPRGRGKTTFCRQCGRAYRPSRTAAVAHPLPFASFGELRLRLKPKPQPVFFLDV